MKGITKNGRSWVVRIYRNGKEHSTSFAFSKYGGEEEALAAAIDFQEKAESEIPATEPTKILKNNKTGVTGVTKGYVDGNSGFGSRLLCYVATWVEKGKKKHRRFTYQPGDDASESEAFKKAVSARKQAESSVYGKRTD